MGQPQLDPKDVSNTQRQRSRVDILKISTTISTECSVGRIRKFEDIYIPHRSLGPSRFEPGFLAPERLVAFLVWKTGWKHRSKHWETWLHQYHGENMVILYSTNMGWSWQHRGVIKTHGLRSSENIRASFLGSNLHASYKEMRAALTSSMHVEV